MKKTKKSLLSTVFLFLALLFIFSSCGEAVSDASEEKTDTQSSPEQTEPEAAETDYLETLGTRNFEGADFTFLMTRYASVPELYPPGEEITGEAVHDAMFNRDRRLEKNYNVKILYPEIEIYPTNSGELSAELIRNIRAGDSLGDVYVDQLGNGQNFMGTVFTQGYLLNLRELPNLSLSSPWYSQMVNEQFTFRGKQFMTSGEIAQYMYIGPGCAFMNLNLGTQFNISDLDVYSKVREGKWTYDLMLQYAESVEGDLNGDGKITWDTDRFGVVYQAHDLAASVYLASAGIKMSENLEDQIVVNMASERAINVVEYIDEHFEKFTCSDVELFDPLYKSGRALFALHYVESTIRFFRDMEDDYVVLPMPKFDEQQDSYVSLINPWSFAFLGIPKLVDDIDKTTFITEAMAYLSMKDVRPAIYEITLKGKLARVPQCQEMLDIVFNTTYLDFEGIFNFGNTLTTAKNSMFNDEEYVSTLKKSERLLERAIDRFIGIFNAETPAE